MSSRILRVIIIIVLGAGCFLLGYYNDSICTFFFNKDAMIGLLLAGLLGYFLYSQYLEKKLIRKEGDSNKIWELEEQKRNRKTYHQKLDEVKSELIEEMHKLYKQVKK